MTQHFRGADQLQRFDLRTRQTCALCPPNVPLQTCRACQRSAACEFPRVSTRSLPERVAQGEAAGYAGRPSNHLAVSPWQQCVQVERVTQLPPPLTIQSRWEVPWETVWIGKQVSEELAEGGAFPSPLPCMSDEDTRGKPPLLDSVLGGELLQCVEPGCWQWSRQLAEPGRTTSRRPRHYPLQSASPSRNPWPETRRPRRSGGFAARPQAVHPIGGAFLWSLRRTDLRDTARSHRSD